MVIVDLDHTGRWNALSERVARQNRAAIKVEPLSGLNLNIELGDLDPPRNLIVQRLFQLFLALSTIKLAKKFVGLLSSRSFRFQPIFLGF
jgi:hypothetical protein